MFEKVRETAGACEWMNRRMVGLWAAENGIVCGKREGEMGRCENGWTMNWKEID